MGVCDRTNAGAVQGVVHENKGTASMHDTSIDRTVPFSNKGNEYFQSRTIMERLHIIQCIHSKFMLYKNR